MAADEELRDSKGRLIDSSDAEPDAVDKVRRRGRPALLEAGGLPLVRVRIAGAGS